MFERLNEQTRQIVINLVSGQKTKIGDLEIGPFDDSTQLTLQVIAENLDSLKELKGDSLANELSNLFSTSSKYDLEGRETKEIKKEQICWRLNKVTTYSYRGLAPAECEWEYDFNSDSHLIYGPNGSGKSSIFGAIAWCLTGKIFRDDCPPGSPQKINIYSLGKKRKKIGTHSDAHSLLKSDGSNTDSDGVYYVSLELSGITEDGEQQKLYVKRDSTEMLTGSTDGENWFTVHDLAELGISNLDLELFLLMPARIPHLRFGENKDLVELFSEIIGVDDLSKISEVASALTQGLRRLATKEEGELKEKLLEYKEAATKSRNLIIQLDFDLDTKELNDDVNPDENAVVTANKDAEVVSKKISSVKSDLATSLGLDVPDKDTPEYQDFISNVDDLAGRVKTALEKLSDPNDLKGYFTICDPNYVFSEDEISSLETSLKEYEFNVREKIQDRLEWAVKEAEDDRVRLKLTASEFLDESKKQCPLCEQELKEPSPLFEELLRLKPLAEQKHIKKQISDLELDLCNQFDFPDSFNQKIPDSIQEWIKNEWKLFKSNYFGGILKSIADRFDDALEELVRERNELPLDLSIDLLGDHENSFSGQFEKIKKIILAARRYLHFKRTVQLNADRIQKGLIKLLIENETGGQKSLREILQQGEDAKQQLVLLEPLGLKPA